MYELIGALGGLGIILVSLSPFILAVYIFSKL